MIDQGFCFNAGEWNFPDAPLRGLYQRHRVYGRSPESNRSSPGWIAWNNASAGRSWARLPTSIPPEWYNDEYDQLGELLARLDRRRQRVRELIVSARDSGASRFLIGSEHGL